MSPGPEEMGHNDEGKHGEHDRPDQVLPTARFVALNVLKREGNAAPLRPTRLPTRAVHAAVLGACSAGLGDPLLERLARAEHPNGGIARG